MTAPEKAEKLSVWQRVTRERDQMRQAVRVVRMGLRGLYRSQLPRMAAALAYRTIFSIIPVFVISLLVFSAFVSDRQLEMGITRILSETGLDTIVIDEAASVGMDTDGGDQDVAEPDPAPQADDPPAREAEAPAREEFRIDRIITELVSRVRGSVENIVSAPIAIVSALILIYAALSMLVELERSFNQIFRASSGRQWLRRLILYWTMMTLGSILLAATFSAGDQFKDWATSLVGGGRAAAAGLGFFVTVVISTLLLTIAYLAVPNTRVKLRPALVGAIVAAVLWELGKWGFRQYLDFSAGYTTFYGSLGLLPLFLIWVYATWLIVLFGLQVAYAMQNFSAFDLGEASDEGPLLVDPASILVVAVAVARRFASGKTASPEDLAEEVGLPDAVTARMLHRLARAGAVHVVEVGEDHAYALARPPEAIEACSVLDAGADLGVREQDAILSGLSRARERALEGRTLADLLAGGGKIPDSGLPPASARSE